MSSNSTATTSGPSCCTNRRKVSIARKNAIVSKKHFICMVGLPARGKTYISKKLCRYLTWIGVQCRVFNVGEYRRKATTQYNNHEFFLCSNKQVSFSCCVNVS